MVHPVIFGKFSYFALFVIHVTKNHTPEEQAAEQAVWNSPSLTALPSRLAVRIVNCVI
jgi:hypothetical protein